MAPLPARRAVAPAARSRRGSSSRCRARSRSASTRRSSSSSSSAPRRSIRRSASSGRTCSPPDFDAAEALRRLRAPERAVDRDRGGPHRPARAGRHRQRLQERGAVARARLAVHAGRRRRRRDARTGSSRRPADSSWPTPPRPAARSESRPPATEAPPARSTSTAGPAGHAAAAGRRSRAAARGSIRRGRPTGARSASPTDRERDRRRLHGLDGDGWRCRVTVTDDRGASTFDVSVPPVGPFLLSVLPDPAFRDIDGLVHETFAFLLEREPRQLDPGALRPPGRRALLPGTIRRRCGAVSGSEPARTSRTARGR